MHSMTSNQWATIIRFPFPNSSEVFSQIAVSSVCVCVCGYIHLHMPQMIARSCFQRKRNPTLQVSALRWSMCNSLSRYSSIPQTNRSLFSSLDDLHVLSHVSAAGGSVSVCMEREREREKALCLSLPVGGTRHLTLRKELWILGSQTLTRHRWAPWRSF